jgi:putative AlgH/UPF0301 family transcriptional regulator
MANELCLTDDAMHSDFKFFNWACIWPDEKLQKEINDDFWLVIDGPPEVMHFKITFLHLLL